MKKLLTFSLLTLSLLAHAKDVKYYYGSVKYFGADGLTPIGDTVSLLERTIDPETNSITEVVLQPKTAGEKAQAYTTHIERIDGGNTFKTYDDGKTFSGTMVYSGDDWKWNQWSYDLNVMGGLLKGKGQLSSAGIETEKTFTKKTGEIVMLIRDQLSEISAKKYQKLKKEISSGK
ncbi:MAG: hypothetical protein ACOYL6_14535 [Bacteriovoracaceae bacterium]